ncbi:MULTISPECIES: hypothetical protein [unclassified Nocardiopsis]|uniref:hypothetical protein n=1 Tax=unclassified Nocardiopsis TaxID=2649073 RepID=UPI00135949B4|nr:MULTISPECIES: hypothetical protein [unclassified Nocardiopsis]
MTEYTVTVVWDEGLWSVAVDGLPRHAAGLADHRHLSELRDEVPEAIADLTDSDPEDFTITWRYELGGRDVTEELLLYLAAEERFRASQRERDRTRDRILESLRDAGLSPGQMADIVGIPHQRVHQLLHRVDAPVRGGRGAAV